MEAQTLDAATGDDTQNMLFVVKYEFNSNLGLGVNLAKFRAMNKKDYKTEEINYFVNYNWNDKLTAELMYAMIDDKNSLEDTDQIRAIITYRY